VKLISNVEVENVELPCFITRRNQFQFASVWFWHL